MGGFGYTRSRVRGRAKGARGWGIRGRENGGGPRNTRRDANNGGSGEAEFGSRETGRGLTTEARRSERNRGGGGDGETGVWVVLARRRRRFSPRKPRRLRKAKEGPTEYTENGEAGSRRVGAEEEFGGLEAGMEARKTCEGREKGVGLPRSHFWERINDGRDGVGRTCNPSYGRGVWWRLLTRNDEQQKIG